MKKLTEKEYSDKKVALINGLGSEMEKAIVQLFTEVGIMIREIRIFPPDKPDLVVFEEDDFVLLMPVMDRSFETAIGWSHRLGKPVILEVQKDYIPLVFT